MNNQKEQSSKKAAMLGSISFLPIATLFITGLVLYLIQPENRWSVHSFGGLMILFVHFLSVFIIPTSFIFGILGIVIGIRGLKEEKKLHAKAGLILSCLAMLIIVGQIIILILQLQH